MLLEAAEVVDLSYYTSSSCSFGFLAAESSVIWLLLCVLWSLLKSMHSYFLKDLCVCVLLVTFGPVYDWWWRLGWLPIVWDIWGSKDEDHRVTNQLRLECKDKITKDHRKEGKKDDTNFENITGLFINSPTLGVFQECFAPLQICYLEFVVTCCIRGCREWEIRVFQAEKY